MAEFCRTFNMTPSDYKALTLNEYLAFMKTITKD